MSDHVSPTLRHKLFLNLFAEYWPYKGVSPVNMAITVLVLASIFAAALSSAFQAEEAAARRKTS